MPRMQPLRLTLVTPPQSLPVSLPEVKSQMSIDDGATDDDALLQGFLEAATDEAERFTRRALLTQTWQLFRDGWPHKVNDEVWWEGVREGPESLLNTGRDDLELPRPPLQSVTHVKTYDDSDTATVFASSNYFVSAPTSEIGRVVLRTSGAAPVITRVADGLEVQFVAGYGDSPGDVPEAIRQGILMTTAWLYTNRGDCEDASKNSGARALWQKYRVLRL